MENIRMQQSNKPQNKQGPVLIKIMILYQVEISIVLTKVFYPT